MDTSRAAISACPRCGAALQRRRRSLLDRLRSLFTAKARYRCAARCGWEGLILRIRRDYGRSRHVIEASSFGPDVVQVPAPAAARSR